MTCPCSFIMHIIIILSDIISFFEIPNDNLWEASMSGLGGRYRIWANFPKDPIMN